MPKEYALRRVDQPESGSHGWSVTMMRKGVSYSKFFAGKRHGGRDKALASARAYRDKLDEENPRPTRADVANKLRPNNTSGIPGVYRREEKNPNGKVLAHWAAKWPSPVDGRPKSKKFSIQLYGEKKAKALACEARERALKELAQQEFVRAHVNRAPVIPPKRVEKARIDFYVEKRIANWLTKLAQERGVRKGTVIAELLEQAHSSASDSVGC
jgi:hypothetical protein